MEGSEKISIQQNNADGGHAITYGHNNPLLGDIVC